MEDSVSFASNHAKASRYRKLETRVQELTDRLRSVDRTVEELTNRHFTCDDVKPYQARSSEEKQVYFVDASTEGGDTDVDTAGEAAEPEGEADQEEEAEEAEAAEPEPEPEPEPEAESKEATAKVETDAATYELDSDDSYYNDDDAKAPLEPTVDDASDSNVPSLIELAKELDIVKKAVVELSRRLGSVPNLQKQICDLSKQVVGAHPSFVAC